MESGILIKSTVLKKEEKMKKIYTIIFVSCLAAISFSSCSDWLDVRPADEIKEEYLFETGNGYRTALNGIYPEVGDFRFIW